MVSCCEGDTFKVVQDYYGKVLQNSGNLKTSACTAASAPPLRIRQILSKIPDEVLEKFYGCGAPLPEGTPPPPPGGMDKSSLVHCASCSTAFR